MILVVDMNWKKDSLGFYEFVLPIVTIAKTQDECTVKHFLEVTHRDLSQCDRVILSGTALKDTATLSQPEKFRWLKETEKPVLGICAGMETIGVVFGMPLIRSLEIGMTQINMLKENPLFGETSRLTHFTATASSLQEILRFGQNPQNASKSLSIKSSLCTACFFILK